MFQGKWYDGALGERFGTFKAPVKPGDTLAAQWTVTAKLVASKPSGI